MQRWLVIGFVLAMCVPAVAQAAPEPVASSLTLNQAAPVYGDKINFTIVYPKEAARQSRQNQYPGSPQTQIDCYVDGVLVWRELEFPQDKQRIEGGWTAQTNLLPMGKSGVDGKVWPVGRGGTCYAYLFSNDAKNDQHVWAYLQFEVGASG